MSLPKFRHYLTGLATSGLLAIFFALFCYAAAAEAATAHVTGTVTDSNGIGVGDVSVTAVALDGGSSNGPVFTSPIIGSYDLAVDTGSSGHLYDFHFAPPPGSGLKEVVDSNVLVTADQVLDAALPPATHTFTGTLRDAAGNPVPGVRVALNNDNATAVCTDSNGNIPGITKNADTYSLNLAWPAGCTDGSGHFVNNQFNSVLDSLSFTGSVDLSTGDVAQDLQLPTLSDIAVNVKDANGNPVGGIDVGSNNQAHGTIQASPTQALDGSVKPATGTTDTSSGIAHLAMFNGLTFTASSICAFASGGSVCLTTPLTVNGNTTASITIPATHTFSGTLRDAAGNPVPGVRVTLNNDNGSAVCTDVNGNIPGITQNAGTYSVKFAWPAGCTDGSGHFVNNQYVSVLDSLNLTGNVDLSAGDVAQDFQLPALSDIAVSVTDSAGNPFGGIDVGGAAAHGTVQAATLLAKPAAHPTDATTGIAHISMFNGLTFDASNICADAPGEEACYPGSLSVNGSTSINIIVYDNTAPTLGTPSWDTNPITVGQTANLTVPVTDAISGVAGGEYYLGSTDPGQGNGTPIAYDGANLIAGLGSNLAPGTYAVNVRAVDAAGNWSGVTTTNLVVNPAGTAPAFISPSMAIAGTGAAFSFTVATTGSPAPALTYTGSLPAGLSFTDNGDGTATMAGNVSGTAGTYALAITAANSAGSAQQSFVLTVNPVTITSASSDTETFGAPFSFPVTTTGNPTPAITKTGRLPTGVTLTDNGDGTASIAGTPTGSASGPYSLTIKAKNSLGTVTQTFVLSITKSPVIKNITNKTAHVGAAFSMNVTSTGYDTPFLAVSGLPTGLSFTASGNGTGTIAGIPATGSGGQYFVTVTAMNSYGTATKKFVMKADEGPAITSAASANATVGSAFSFQVTATGYPAPSISKSGTLPSGVTYHGSTRTFSGTPRAGSAGTYPITITAKNSTATATQSFVLTVN